jgi:D-beta-D-heptose 7-phosphate kinase/D-beta-D-heptose 1-phosphate adenosyltransferase
MHGKQWWRNAVLRFAGVRIAGIGDMMVDKYFTARQILLSPEAPVLDLRCPELKTQALGGAGNTARNAAALGAEVFLVCTVGQDEEGEWIKKSCAEDEKLLLLPVSYATTVVKERYYNRGWQQIIRFSYEPDAGEVAAACASHLVSRLEDLARKELAAFFVADYGKGVVSPPVVDFFRRMRMRKEEMLVVWDPKVGNAHCYQKGMCTVMTPNLQEARELVNLFNFPAKSPQSEKEMAPQLAQEFTCDICITLGERGSYYYAHKERRGWHVPTAAQPVYDVAGAGDTFVAVLTLGLAAGLSRGRAVKLANAAGSVVVSKKGTATATTEELVVAAEKICAAP